MIVVIRMKLKLCALVRGSPIRKRATGKRGYRPVRNFGTDFARTFRNASWRGLENRLKALTRRKFQINVFGETRNARPRYFIRSEKLLPSSRNWARYRYARDSVALMLATSDRE